VEKIYRWIKKKEVAVSLTTWWRGSKTEEGGRRKKKAVFSAVFELAWRGRKVCPRKKIKKEERGGISTLLLLGPDEEGRREMKSTFSGARPKGSRRGKREGN